jgi:hypothetical protein
MRAYIAILVAFMRRIDRWLLLRAPMLWRAQPPRWLVLLSLAILAAIPFMETSIKTPIEAGELAVDIEVYWWLELTGVVVVLWRWVSIIVRRPVGELPPRRHLVTVVAVAIGSYLWLVTPSWLAYQQISAIKRVDPGDQQLKADDEVISRYSRWECVPPDVFDNKDEVEQLRKVLVSYGADVRDVKKGREGDYCTPKDRFWAEPWRAVSRTRRAIEAIKEARDSGTDSGFYFIRTGPYWGLAVALGLGILTAVFSYPRYVWRRTFSRG